MDTRKIITISIVVLAFAGAGVFAYMTFFSTPDTAALDTLSGKATSENVVLPYGTKLDFSTVEKFNKSGKLFPYPSVSPSEIGVPLNNTVN